jgi:hypothetical protein
VVYIVLGDESRAVLHGAAAGQGDAGVATGESYQKG